MYFITGFKHVDEDYGVQGARCFGYYNKFEDADYAVRTNSCDINETIYNYMIIEEFDQGIHVYPENRWVYKFDEKNKVYNPIEEPEGLEHFCNFAMG